MDHLIGQRFNLISKSEIRYVGTLHEINPEQSTIALEDVYSFGTEDRKVDNFIPPSPQKFDYIVFRGSDVKDIKVAEEQTQNEQPPPSNVPNDPAILNASRPGGPGHGPPPFPGLQSRGESPFHPPPGYGPNPQFGGYYPPPQFGRGFGPPPGQFGPGPGFQPYGPPPPGYFGPPGQGFPHSPQFQSQSLSQPPIGPPGQRAPGPYNQPPQQIPQQQPSSAPAPATSELPVNSNSTSQVPDSTAPGTSVKAVAPETKPAEEAQTFTQSKPNSSQAGPSSKPTTILKNNKVATAVPFQVNRQSFIPPTTATNGDAANLKPAAEAPQSRTDMEEASRQAKEAVAAAMAKLNPPTAVSAKPAPPTNTAAAVDALSRKLGAMTTSDNITRRGRGGYRGDRGNGFRRGSGGQNRKIDIPQSDYDFERANAKFNKEDLIKEAIASGSPIEGPADGLDSTAEDTVPNPSRKDSIPLPTAQAYNKSSSFFDNISSESKDREGGFEAGGRVARGEEFKRNLETFGQGNVDGFRGRGRGYGRGRGFGRGRGRGNYNRGQGGQQPQTQTLPTQAQT